MYLLVYTSHTNTSLIEAVKYFVYLAEMKLLPSLVCCYYHNNSSTKSRYHVDFLLHAGIQATGCPPHPRRVENPGEEWNVNGTSPLGE